MSDSSDWYKAGYTEGYNWYMAKYGGQLMPPVPEPTSPKTMQNINDYMIGQMLGEMDAGTIRSLRDFKDNQPGQNQTGGEPL